MAVRLAPVPANPSCGHTTPPYIGVPPCIFRDILQEWADGTPRPCAQPPQAACLLTKGHAHALMLPIRWRRQPVGSTSCPWTACRRRPASHPARPSAWQRSAWTPASRAPWPCAQPPQVSCLHFPISRPPRRPSHRRQSHHRRRRRLREGWGRAPQGSRPPCRRGPWSAGPATRRWAQPPPRWRAPPARPRPAPLARVSGFWDHGATSLRCFGMVIADPCEGFCKANNCSWKKLLPHAGNILARARKPARNTG